MVTVWAEVLKVYILPNLLYNYKCASLIWLKWISAGMSSVFLHLANVPNAKLLTAKMHKILTSSLQRVCENRRKETWNIQWEIAQREMFQLLFLASIFLFISQGKFKFLLKTIGYILSFTPSEWCQCWVVVCGVMHSRQAIHSQDLELGLPAATCRITFQGSINQVREDKITWLTWILKKAVTTRVYQ